MARTYDYDVVIVGAGIAGLTAAYSARQTDTRKSILLINNEDRLPYKRTRVSTHLASGFTPDQFALHDRQWYARHQIELRDGELSSLDPVERAITLAPSDERITYRSLVLATGSTPLFPRIVRHHERDSFVVVRSAADGEALIERLRRSQRVLIAGMGVLAVEIADQLVQLGKDITLAGATAQLIPRHLDERAGELLEERMRAVGVKLSFRDELLSFEKSARGGWSVELLRGSAHYDAVVICIGVEPEVRVARDAGVACARGITVNEYLESSVEGIYAAGDCAEHPGGIVTELWHAAEDQGGIAGVNAAGGHERYNQRAQRLKSRVFGLYLFSIGKPGRRWNGEIETYEGDDQYYAFYLAENERVMGVVMANDEQYASVLVEAVRAGDPLPRLLERLDIESV